MNQQKNMFWNHAELMKAQLNNFYAAHVRKKKGHICWLSHLYQLKRKSNGDIKIELWDTTLYEMIRK